MMKLIDVLNEIAMKYQERTGVLNFNIEEIKDAAARITKELLDQWHKSIWKFRLPFTNPHTGTKEDITIQVESEDLDKTGYGLWHRGEGLLIIYVSRDIMKRVRDNGPREYERIDLTRYIIDVLSHELVHAFDPAVYSRSKSRVRRKWGYHNSKIEVRAFMQQMYEEAKRHLLHIVKAAAKDIEFLRENPREVYQAYALMDLAAALKNPQNLLGTQSKITLFKKITDRKEKQRFFNMLYALVQKEIPHEWVEEYKQAKYALARMHDNMFD